MTTPEDRRQPYAVVTLVALLAVVVGVGALIGSRTTPGAWYEALDKPPFNPPNWVFGPVWFTLYVLIALAGWRILMAAPKSVAMGLWVVQMVLNWIWSPVFFNARNLALALVVVLALLGAIVGFILTARPVDRLAAWLFVPYAAWVSFAALLCVSLVVLN